MSALAMPLPERADHILPSHLEEDTLSVVVFGPGEGEAIVVALPDGSIGIVDGCREANKDNPVRELLDGIEDLRPGFPIAFVCLTHPHDDHYGGWGRLLADYRPRIDGVWTVAPVSGRYHKLLLPHVESLRAVAPAGAPDDEKVKGLSRVLGELDAFRKASPDGYQELTAGQKLLRRRILGRTLRLEAWGPAPNDLRDALDDLVSAVQDQTEEREPRRHDPNITSGALAISWGKARVLLAGDLLRGAGQRVGWRAAHPHAKETQVVNVAHHASDEAHDETLWKAMQPDLAIVTPFRNATGDMPPRPDSIARLADDCTVVITAKPDWPKDPNHPKPIRPKAKPRAPRGTPRKLSARPEPADPSRCAVSVSLNADGEIVRWVLASNADIYK